MPTANSAPPKDDERDLLDVIPGLNRASSHLHRSLGPGCLLSMIITALIIVVLRRYVKLPLPGMILLAIGVWWAVLVVLLRLGGPPPDDEL